MKTRSALPGYLKVWWFCFAPVAMVFAMRVMWEKTVWTSLRGPQMVGFSLMHIHPMLAIVGTASCLAFMVWLLLAIPYAIGRRKVASVADVAMIGCAAFVVAAIVIPDTLFA